MRYAHYEDITGKLLGWYDDAINAVVPTPNLQITEDVTVEPNANFVDVDNNQVILKDLRTLYEVKADKHTEIKNTFNKKLSAGFTCSNGITMDAIIDKVQLLKNGYDLSVKLGLTTMGIRDFYNTVHPGTATTDVATMIDELGVNYQTMLSTKWSYDDAIDACTTITDVLAISWL